MVQRRFAFRSYICSDEPYINIFSINDCLICLTSYVTVEHVGKQSPISSYPASKLKLYIHDVLAALNTLHQTRWCFSSTKNSQGLGLCRESFPTISSPRSLHAFRRCFLLFSILVAIRVIFRFTRNMPCTPSAGPNCKTAQLGWKCKCAPGRRW